MENKQINEDNKNLNLDIDYIWENHEFIQNLMRVANEEYQIMVNRLRKEGLNDEDEEWLFDYIYNEPQSVFFDEWLFEKKNLKFCKDTFKKGEKG